MEILKSPLNYTGSKQNLIDQLNQYFPKDVDTFYDLFCGGLSVSMNTDYPKTIANDVVKPQVQFYQLNKSAESVDSEISTILDIAIDKENQEEYNRIRKVFNETQNPYLFFALVCSCTNNMMRFNKKMEFNQSFGKRTINPSTVEKLKKYIDRLSTKNIEFTNYSFTDVIKHIPPTNKDFVYLDPPYTNLLTEAGYNAYWTKAHEESLYGVLDDLDSRGVRFALSGVSVHKGIENPYLNRLKKYKIIELSHDYEKVARKKNLGDSQEILTINY